MILFEGKWASDNNTLIVDGITLGTVAGHPEKVHLTKATGMCPANQKVITCTAQTITGQLYEVLSKELMGEVANETPSSRHRRGARPRGSEHGLATEPVSSDFCVPV